MMIVSLDKRKQTINPGNTTYKGRENPKVMFVENNLIIFDESDTGKPDELIIVGSYVKLDDLHDFYNVGKRFPKSKGSEVKYKSVNPSDRILILREINNVTFEVWDSLEYKLPDIHQMRLELKGYVETSNDYTIAYVYTVKRMLEDIMSTHYEKTNVYMDSKPTGTTANMLALSRLLVEEGYPVEFFKAESSTQNKYLQVHDFVTGFDRDIRKNKTNNARKFPNQSAIGELIARFESKRRRKDP